MMKKIWKFQLPIQDELHLGIPGGGGKVVLVANQDDQLTVWMEVDTEEPEKIRTLRIVGTGNPIGPAEDMVHVGSAVVGLFVWHVYSSHGG